MIEVDVFKRIAVPTPYTLAHGYTIHIECQVESGVRKARGIEPITIIIAEIKIGFTRLWSIWVNQACKKMEKSMELR